MLAPVRALRKKDVEWLASNRCKHSHTFLEHYQCFISEQPEMCPFVEKVGYLDIETTDLVANYGYMTSYAIKLKDGGIIGRTLTQREIRSFVFDEKLVEECCNKLRDFHRIVVYYGSDYRFDIPFLRTRAIKYGLDFPLYKEVFVQDVYSAVKAKLRLTRRSLEVACRTFEIPTKETRLTYPVTIKAMTGDKASLDTIWQHNIEDVISLEILWEKLEPYVRKGRSSL